MKLNPTAGLAVAAACLIALTGCVVPAPLPTPAPPTTAAPLKFGSTYTWPDGWAVSVSDPSDYTPGKDAEKPESGHYLMVTVTISSPDDGGDLLPITDLDIYARSHSTLCGEVVDETEGLNGGTDAAMIGRGEFFDIPVAFGVDDPSDFTVTVYTKLDHTSATFGR